MFNFLKMFLIYAVLMMSQQAYADAVIFSGPDVKTLKPNIDLNGNAKILSGAVDPTSSATSAPVGSLYLNTSTGLSYRKLDAGSSTNWVVLGSGGSSSKNYVTNPEAEAATTGWTAYADAAGTSPVDCTGGSPTTTWTRVTSTPLAGIGSFLYTHAASNQQGEGVSTPFTIDASDKGKVLTIKLAGIVASGTFAAGAVGAESDIEVFVYDVTNSRLIEPSNKKLFSSSATVSENYSGQFQAAADSTSYRLCLHNPNTTATAFTWKADLFSIAPSQYSYGTPVTDWTAWTPTGTWSSNSTYTGFWRRVGDSMQVKVKVALAGAPTSAGLGINIPTGYTIDTAKLPQTTAGTGSVGTGTALDSGVATYPLVVDYSTTTSVSVYTSLASGTYGTANNVTQAVPITFGSADAVDVDFTVPIAGWSSSVQTSDNADGRVVAAFAYGKLATGTINSSLNAVVFPTVDGDTHNAFNTSTGGYTVPVAGIYDVSCTLNLSAASTTVGQYIAVGIRVDSTDLVQQYVPAQATTILNQMVTINNQVKVNTGQIIYCASRSSQTTPAHSTGLGGASFSFRRNAGLSAISATESVSAKYYTSVAQSLATATTTIIDFASKVWDTHGAVTTGAGWKFTAPISGEYCINAMTQLASSAAWGTNELNYDRIYVNGVGNDYTAYSYAQNTGTYAFTTNGSITVKLLAGDYVQLEKREESGSTIALSGSNNNNFIEIKRCGNY